MDATDPARHPTVFDDATQHVARVYAEALLNSAQKAGQAAEMVEDLDALVHEVLSHDPYLEAFLTSRAIGRERKAQALRAAFKGRASDLLLNFLLVLNDHDRLEALRAIAATAHHLYENRAGLVHVQVRSAVPLADDQRDQLRGAEGQVRPRPRAGGARRSRPAGRPDRAGRRRAVRRQHPHAPGTNPNPPHRE